MRKNTGNDFEKMFTEKLGYTWEKDNRKWNQSSDIPELKMSIKTLNASIFTLKDNRKASEVNADTSDNTRLKAVEYFISNVHSETFIIGMPDDTYYQLDLKQVKLFLQIFTQLDNESRTKEEKKMEINGKLKLRIQLKSNTRQKLVIEFMEENGIERKSL